MFTSNDEPVYTASINKSTAKSLVRNILRDTCPNRELMAEYLVEQIGSSLSDFMGLFGEDIPVPLFSVGDRVRITKKAASLYDVDYEQTIVAGYGLGEGLYCEILSVSRSRREPYLGKISYITMQGNEEVRSRSFADADVLIDKTILLNTSSPTVAKVL